jgi:hypothetical protein
MIEIIAEQVIKELMDTTPSPPFSGPLPSVGWTPLPVLTVKIDFPEKEVFDRGDFYELLLTQMGEPTYQQRMHIDIHAETNLQKRQSLRGKAAVSNDRPELRKAAQEAMHRHGVRVVFLDEAHHLMYARDGAQGSTLQEQLEWLKSLSGSSPVLYILVGTYDLLSFGRLSGQLARRSKPIHFPRYQLQRQEDCTEFQAALLTLLKKAPLHCDAATFVKSYWLYFYECSIGCIGVLKDWLQRAVSAALDEGHDTLTLDCIQDHAPLVEIYRQMAIDATEGEQKLEYTASNREHVWRLLQGGELIGPVPPLPPRTDQPPVVIATPDVATPSPSTQLETTLQDPPPPVVKKTRTRKKPKAEEPVQDSETSSTVDAPPAVTPIEQTVQLETTLQDASPPVIKKARTRKKPKAEEPVQDPETPSTIAAPPAVTPKQSGRGRKKTTENEVQIAASPLPVQTGEEGNQSVNGQDGSPASSQTETVATPKRPRRPGERKPKRDRVGEPVMEDNPMMSNKEQVV